MINLPFKTDEGKAVRVLEWLRERGGVLVWEDPSRACESKVMTPATGEEEQALDWMSKGLIPTHIKNLSDIVVQKVVPLGDISVSLRMENGELCPTDESISRVAEEFERLREEHVGKEVWYYIAGGMLSPVVQFHMTETEVTMAEWAEKGPGTAQDASPGGPTAGRTT